MLLFYKSVDKSVLTSGLTIPVVYQSHLFSEIGFELKRGEKKNIQICIDGVRYPALITNINFDRVKYPGHKDLLQIRYGEKSLLAQKLREIFQYTGNLICSNKQERGTTRLTGLSEHEKEFIAIYSSSEQGQVLFDCIPNRAFNEESTELAAFGELEAERILDGSDSSADLIIKTKQCKIRKLTRTIGDDLKKLYGYRCQICGEYIGMRYDSHLIHAHHIDYFVHSMNNNASNIMIVCPNHHGIIHDRNPEFDFKKREYHYPNGLVEGLKINLHL